MTIARRLVMRVRLGAVALAVAGVLFVLYPALRPWHDESTVEGAKASMSSAAWVASHGFAMIGFVLLALGLLAVWAAVRTTRAEPVAFGAVVTGWLGAGLVLPYYGAEDFGLHALASAGAVPDLLDVVNAVRFQPFAITLFGAGLVLLAVSGVLLALAVIRSRRLNAAAAILAGLGLLLFLPQFYSPPAVRVGHGVMLGVGLAWLALSTWRAGTTTEGEA
jgi:hypothetical protein